MRVTRLFHPKRASKTMSTDPKKDEKKPLGKQPAAAATVAKEEPNLSFAAFQARPAPATIGTADNQVTVAFGLPDKDKVTVRSSADSKQCVAPRSSAKPIVDAYNKALIEGKVDFSGFDQKSGPNPLKDSVGNISWALGSAGVKAALISVSNIAAMCPTLKLPAAAVGLAK